MSTQSIITFKDDRGEHSIFRHWDGYPSAVLPDLIALFESNYVWPLPRFEADEAAAGMVAMYKREPGNYRLTDAKMGRDYGYSVSEISGVIHVVIAGRGDAPEAGTLAELAQKYAK